MSTWETNLRDLMERNPIIGAVKNEKELEACCQEKEILVSFVLYGSVLSIGEVVSRLHDSGKMVFVHIDLIEGLSGREIAVDFIQENTVADGIISTKPTLIRRARTLGMASILRLFLLDSLAYENVRNQVKQGGPDCIEIMPGLIPKAIKRISRDVKIPVIAGGLISDREDVVAALNAGAAAVSSTNVDVWKM